MSRARYVSARENWRNVLARFADCQMTVAEFCELESISESNFYRWKRRLSADPPPTDVRQEGDDRVFLGGSSCGSPEFVPVRVPAANSEPIVRLCLPGGAVVELTASLSRERLIDLVAATVAATNSVNESSISHPVSDVTSNSHGERPSC
jgi:hypothetical protein